MNTLVKDTKLSGLIEGVLKDFVKSGRLFTAFDVTKEVRNRADSDFYVSHGDVKNVVHSTYMKEEYPFQNGSDYVQSSEYIGGQMATVYHPLGANLCEYNPDDIKTVKRFTGKHHLGHGLFVVPSVKNNANTTPVVKKTITSFGSISRTSRRRLLIPADVCEAIGLHPRNVAFICSGKDSIRIFKSGQSKYDYVLTVDKYRNLRLSATILGSLSDDQSVFDISVDGNEIIIS